MPLAVPKLAVLVLVLLLLSLSSPFLPAEEPAVPQPLPAENGRSLWRTRHLVIESEVPLSPPRIARIAAVCDGTFAALKACPLPLYAPPPGDRARVIVYADAARYEAAGGPPGTAGIYLARRFAVLLLADFVAPDEETAKRFPPGHDEDVVVHELIHLGMHGVNSRLPQWFLEGTAEYFACAHISGGRFSFVRMEESIRDHLRRRLNPQRPEISLVPAAEVLSLTPHTWLRTVARLPAEDRYRAYATSLLLAHYYLNGGKERLDQVRTVLASTERIPPALCPAAAGPEIEAALIRFWRPRSLSPRFEIHFPQPSTE